MALGKSISYLTSTVTKRKVTGLEPRFAPVLAIDALSFHLQLKKEHRLTRAGDMRARMPYDLRVRVNVGDGDVAEARTRDRAVEVVDIRRIGDQRIEAVGRVVVPMRKLAAAIETNGRE